MTGLRRKDVFIILASVLIGGAVIGLNVLQFNASQELYTFSYADGEAVREDQPLTTSFTIRDPRAMETVTVTVTLRSVTPDREVTLSVNDQTRRTQSGLRPGASISTAVEPGELRRENRIRLSTTGVQPPVEVGRIAVTGATSTRNTIFLLLNIVGLLVIIGPILVTKYMEYSRVGELEEQFPNFLRDVVEGTRAGMSLPQAIQNTRHNDYGRLSPYVEEVGAKLEWGIPFETALSSFARKTRSSTIRRAVNTIIQTYQSGGNVSEVLDAVGNNLKEIRKLRKERESQIYGEMITGYIIYFVFLLVLVVLVRYFLPALTFGGDIGPLQGSGLSSGQLIATYRSVFRFLIIIQSIFSGLVIGRLSEGNLKAGAKHIGILLGIGYTVAAVFM